MSSPPAALRVLRPGPRPFVAIGIGFSVAAAIPLAVFFSRGMWTDAATAAACAILAYGAICIGLVRSRIVVAPHGLAVREAFGRERRVGFDEIVASVPRVLGEPDHPVTLDIFTSAHDVVAEAPALRIRLKSYRREDVQSLLALPALKVTVPAPGSWR